MPIQMTPTKIAQRLHDEEHWPVERIARATGCTRDTVYRWLRGSNEPMGPRALKLARLGEKHLTNGETISTRVESCRKY